MLFNGAEMVLGDTAPTGDGMADFAVGYSLHQGLLKNTLLELRNP